MLITSDLETTFGIAASMLTRKIKLWEPLQHPSEEENILSQAKKAWLLQQSKRPWQNWVRSLGQMWGTIIRTWSIDSNSIHPLLTQQLKGLLNFDPGKKQQGSPSLC